MDPASPAARLSRELSPGEELLWSGRPRQGLVFRRADLLLVPFTVMWCGFAVFWVATVLRGKGPPFFALFGIPFVAVGLHMVFGRFVVDILRRRRIAYGVTTNRVILVSGILRETTVSLPLSGLASLSLSTRPDGSGDIAFGPLSPMAGFVVPGWPGASQFLPPTFEGIPKAREVHDLIGRAQRGQR